MKKILLLLLITTLTFAQVDTTFYGLRGYEDLEGNTQLFYKMNSSYGKIYDGEHYLGESRSDFFHFDLFNNLDSLFLASWVQYADPFPLSGRSIVDFEFVDNSLTDFYHCGDEISSFEPVPVVFFNNSYNNRYQINSFHGITHNLEITKVDSTINIYVHADGSPSGIFTDSSDLSFDLIKSTENYKLLFVNREKPNEMFVTNNDGYLFKSIDTGGTFSLVDSSIDRSNKGDYLNRYFLYDSDSLHIYRIIENQNNFKLVVSNSLGELGTWREVFQSDKNIFISHDTAESGTIYFATGRQIYKSENYGETYNLAVELDKTISGIYKKPNSDLLYVTTPHKLLEINSDSVKVLKQLINYDALSYYPMHVGDKWYYQTEGLAQVGTIIDPRYEGFLFWETKEIIGDTLLNGQKYFTVLQTQIHRTMDTIKYFERCDSLNNRVLLYAEEDDDELNRFDLSSTIGDSVNAILISVSAQKKPVTAYHFADSLINQFGQTLNKKCFSTKTFSTESYFQLAKGFGLIYKKDISSGGNSSTKLVACRINNIIYGDTTIVGVEENSLETIPTTFSLSQNYPNPFNPTTTIEYSIPTSSGFVSLIVYDILGKEVATLVNETKKPGTYKATFNASNLVSGIYYYRLSAGTFSETKKLILLK